MPWCPKCKTEYQEGITTCLDCGCELVLEQPDITDEVKPTELTSKELSEKLLTEDEENMDEESINNETNYSMYETKGSKAKELRSTAITFFVFGIAGLVVVLLNVIGVLRFFSSPLQYILLSAMFIGFLLVGINSYHGSKKAVEDSMKEEKLTTEIMAYLKETINKESILKMKDPSQSEEANVIRILDGIRYAIVTRFGELNESYLDYIAEQYYSTFETTINS